VTWASGAEVFERFPALDEDDLTSLTASGQLAWRSEPFFLNGRFVGGRIFYDLEEVERIVAGWAANELS